MFPSSGATESSEKRAPSRDALGSTDSDLAPANRNNSSSSGQVDNADTTSNITIPTIISPLPLTPPFRFPSPPVLSWLAQPESSIGGTPAYETHIRIDEPLDSAQSASPPSDIMVSPSMPIRHLNQSPPNIRVQSIMISPPVSPDAFTHATIPARSVTPQELSSQYSQEWYRPRTAQTTPPRADAYFTDSSPITDQNLILIPPHNFSPPTPVIPLRPENSHTPSMYYEIPSQSNRPQSPIAPQLYSSGPAQSPPSQFYSLPNAPTSHAIHEEMRFVPAQTHPSYVEAPQQFVPQCPNQVYSIPNTPVIPPITHEVNLHKYNSRRMDSFVANDPFQVSRGDEVEILTFDDIPIPVFSPGANFTPGMSNSPYGSPTFGGISPSFRGYPYRRSSTQPGIYAPSESNVPSPRRPSRRPSRTPEPTIQYQMSYIPGRYNAFKKNNISVPPPPPPSVFEQPVQSQTPVLPESHVPSSTYQSPPTQYSPPIHHSPLTQQSPSLKAYPYRHNSTQPEICPPSNVPPTQIPPSLTPPTWTPEVPDQQIWYDSEKNDISGSPVIPPSPSSSVSEQGQQSQTPVLPEPHVPTQHSPSTQHSPIISESKSDDATTWLPALPIHQPLSPSLPKDRSSNSHESQTGTDESSFRSYIPPYPPHSKYQYPEPPESIFSRLSRFFRRSYDTQSLDSPPPTVIYPPFKPNTNWHEYEFTKAASEFVWVTLPVQIYLHVLLRLPSLYFSRVARIFEEAGMALPHIKRMALETASQGLTHEFEMQMAFESSSVPPAYKRLASTWESFIDSVMREWKTFNIISVLLLSAILTILQIQSAAEDPLTRYTALFSLICSLISLLFGCMYIIRFGSMRKSYKGAEWALEATQTKTIWWNVWVLLAMPAIWLTWSILLYIVCIMSFVWRSGVANTTTPGISNTGLLAVRITITVVLGIGLIYAFLIMITFRQYGAVMDKRWKQRIDKWIAEKATGKYGSFVYPIPGNTHYPSTPYAYPGGSTMYQGPNFPPYYQPPSSDAQSRYAQDTRGPTYPSDTHIPPYRAPSDMPYNPSPSYQGDHAYTPAYVPDSPTRSTDDVTRVNTNLNAGYIPSPPPPLPPQVPITSPEETPPRLVPKPHFVLVPPRKRAGFSVPPPSLPPAPDIPIDRSNNNNVIGSSSELENSNGDVPDDKNQVHFRSPLISDQGSVNLGNKDMDKVPGTPWEPSESNIRSYPSDLSLEYV